MSSTGVIPFDYNPDRKDTAPALLIDLFRDQFAIRAFVSAIGAEIQELEDAIRDTATGFDLLSAVGVQLDAVGQILGVDRNGATDATYRIQLQARLVLLTSSGTAENINSLVRLLLQASGITNPDFRIRPFPLSLEVEIRSIFTGDATNLANLVRSAIAAGVEFRLRTAQATPVFYMDTAGAMDNAHLVDERA